LDLSAIEQFIPGIFRVAGGLCMRKLVGQVLRVWRKSIRRSGTREACVTSGSLEIERALHNRALMRAMHRKPVDVALGLQAQIEIVRFPGRKEARRV